jgi:cytochrome P450
MLNIFAMHTNPRYWGEDSLIWRPSRWLLGNSVKAGADTERQLEQETLFEPKKGTYFPWSGGARVCVGKKFSQVEFVAVVASLFFKHRVYPVAGARETIEQARLRVVKIVEDSLLRMTLQVRNPDLAAVSWKEI